MNKEIIKVIKFDTDDALLINEPYYDEFENYFIDLLSKLRRKELISNIL